MADFEKVYQIKFDTKGAETALKRVGDSLSKIEAKVITLPKSGSAAVKNFGRALIIAAKETQKLEKAQDRARIASERLAARGLAKAEREAQKLAKETARADKEAKRFAEQGLRKIALNAKKAEIETKRLYSSIKRTFRELESIGSWMTTRITLPVIAAATASVKWALDSEDATQRVKIAFGDASDKVLEFSKTSLKQFGIGGTAAKDMAKEFGYMATELGLSNDLAAEMAIKLVGITGDVAEFTGQAQDSVSDALKSAVFTGQGRGLKQINLAMDDAKLKAFALSLGIKRQYKNMSENQKVALRYKYILSETSRMQGEWSRGINDTDERFVILLGQLKETAIALGTTLLPAINDILDKINPWIEKFSKLDDNTKELIISIGLVAAATGPLIQTIGIIGAPGGPVALAVVAFGGLAIAIKSVYDNWQMLANSSFLDFLKPIGAAAKYVARNMTPLGGLMGEEESPDNGPSMTTQGYARRILEEEKAWNPDWLSGQMPISAAGAGGGSVTVNNNYTVHAQGADARQVVEHMRRTESQSVRRARKGI